VKARFSNWADQDHNATFFRSGATHRLPLRPPRVAIHLGDLVACGWRRQAFKLDLAISESDGTPHCQWHRYPRRAPCTLAAHGQWPV